MKILISTPSYQHQVNNEMVMSLLRAVEDLKDENISVNWHSPTSSVLSFNRNLSVERAVKEGFDWLLFWDADISIDTPYFISDMIRSAFTHNCMVVGVPVALKGEPKTLNTAHKTDSGYKNETERTTVADTACDVVGTGIMLIKTELFTKLKPPYFTFIDTYDNQPGFFPEDWNFCEKAKKHTNIWLYNVPITKHWGMYAFTS